MQSFVKRMEEIDVEISTLSQLKAYIHDFLNAMIAHGITQISALPLLYEMAETELVSSPKPDLSMETLNNITDKMARPLDTDIVTLPSMEVVTSVRSDNGKSETESFWDWLSANQIPFGKPGSRTMFEYQRDEELVMMQKLPDHISALVQLSDSAEDLPFECKEFPGGLFATSSAYADEDLGSLQYRMLQSFDDNPNFEVDYLHNGSLRHEALIEAVLSPENHRERIHIYIPVRQRKPNFVDYPDFEMTMWISYEEIEKANPILREYKVIFADLRPPF
ncbi:hypothetical protein M0651_18555 [Paenibacillus sp. MBLB2552]|uniref:Uncharacterized protein n=1 Tax=Paenibacillus mellifer TaxID=2937794 RepID=A0A9X1Y1G8_9BACL|nr:hypothetical protein [Paenibacillus mellifer]MCK8489177.1 hypothetical protein [Paenibacillus mellifer]